MQHIADRGEFDAALQSDRPVLFLFTAAWCKACRSISPMLERFAAELKDEMVVSSVDVQQNDFAVTEMQLSSLPHLMMYNHGEKVGAVVGANPQQICDLVRSVVRRDLPEEVWQSLITANSTTTTAAATPSMPEAPTTPIPSGKHVLNLAPIAGEGAVPSIEIASQLQAAITGLYAMFVSPDGSAVDYEAMKASADFDEYLRRAAQLQALDLLSLTPAQRKAFLLNLYNALCIHGMIALGPPDATVKGSLGAFFGGACYLVGGFLLSLDDIEHGILRGNRIHPTTGLRYFEEGDKRAQLAIACDPRIHCALVCGANSCPALRCFSESNLDEELDAAARGFCEAETSVEMATNTVTTSKIFMWYQSDFGSSLEERLRWIARYLSEEKRRQLLVALDSEAKVSVVYTDYDWTPNAKV